MTQIFIHYEKWEDFHSGMWRKLPKNEEESFRIIAIKFTGNHILYGAAMIRVVNEWPYTCLHNLSNTSINRKAFIGHAACSLQINCPEYIVRQAWWKLTEEQRIMADEQAEIAINLWEQRRKSGITLTNGKRGVIQKGYQMKLRLNWNLPDSFRPIEESVRLC
jgi:hypothetical protein